MENETIRICFQGGSGEITEKKSRFIATVRPVTTEEEALSFVAKCKKKYYDARHNCYAYIADSIMRCSDDGEPSQTAGKPMLDVLCHANVTNIAVVVTRYFGGILLGTGGLVRAYQQATREGLNASVLLEQHIGRQITLTANYNDFGKIEHILREKEIPSVECEYGQKVILHAMIPLTVCETLENEITERTNACADILWGEDCKYVIYDKQVILL